MLQIVGVRGLSESARVRVDAEHLAGDVGGGGRDLVGDAVALPGPDIGPFAAGDIGLVALVRRLLEALGARPHDQEAEDQDRQHGDDEDDHGWWS